MADPGESIASLLPPIRSERRDASYARARQHYLAFIAADKPLPARRCAIALPSFEYMGR